MKHAADVDKARRPSTFSRWWPWLRLLAAAGILVAVMAVLGTRAIAAGLAVITPAAVLAALGIGLLTTVLTALRWRLVARRVGLKLGVVDAITETYRAVFLNAVLPGGVLGDVGRAVRHGRTTGDLGRGARVVAIERTAGQVVLFGAALVVLPAEPAVVVALLKRASTSPVVGVGLGVVMLVAVGVLVARARSSAGTGRWRALLSDAAGDVRAGALSRSAWPGLIGLSAAALAGYLALFVVAARAAGVTASTVALLPPLLLALIAMGLPISVGGWGPREGVAALTFWMAGLGAPLGVTTSVAYGALALIAALPGGLLLLTRRVTRSQRQAEGVAATDLPARHRLRTEPAPLPSQRSPLPAGRPLREHRRTVRHSEAG
jgi:uncharacterized membrane protein YbhN (UPF0104 family)